MSLKGILQQNAFFPSVSAMNQNKGAGRILTISDALTLLWLYAIDTLCSWLVCEFSV